MTDIDLMIKLKGAPTVRALHKTTGLRKKYIRRALEVLRARGLVEKVKLDGGGHEWHLTESGEALVGG